MKPKYVLPLADPGTTLETVGGKGASLARLSKAGLPVPDGFHVTTAAYRRFVSENDLQPGILAALEPVDISQPATLEAASQTIGELFVGAQTPPDVASAIALAYAALAGRDPVVAVRSSATAEDLPEASFAGQQDTFLNVQGYGGVLEAIKRCWASLWTARAIGYRARQGIGVEGLSLAVVVQALVPAEAAGILFTANPVTGQRHQAVISASWGLGEAVVGGLVTPDTLTVNKTTGRVLEREIADKQVMTVRVDGGTETQPVTEALRRAPVLNDQQVAELTRLSVEIEELYQRPQDIEWAIADGKLYLLQSRPITTLTGHDPTTGEWNDSLTGDYLWSNCNLTEAVPDVMTPLTCSMWQIFHTKTAFVHEDHPSPGNICGRPYANVSLAVAMYTALGKDVQGALQEVEGVIGRIPQAITIPPVHISKFSFLLGFLPAIVVRLRKARQVQKEMPGYIASSPDRCRSIQRQIQQAGTKAALTALWRQELYPYFLQACWMLRVSARMSLDLSSKVYRELVELVGEADANAMLLHQGRAAEPERGADLLASLGPAMGIARVARGQMSRQEYLERYGHRGPQECELLAPRPAEDPDWLDQQLAQFKRSPVDVDALLAKRRAEFDAAWQRFQERYPGKVKATQRRLEQVAEAAHRREAVRSEITRLFGVIRTFALRVGELTGLGDGVIFLYRDELMEVLAGDNSAAKYIPARQETHARYSALPPYPGLISGCFDPFQWAADPHRRSDYFDAHAAPVAGSDSDVITGFAGAAGRVEGVVRVLSSLEEGDQFQTGEVLVAVTTNVGWTPLFPRAGAVVTDVGAPLSHAAIVARELGIPAVVGCGNATMRLKTGDRVLVDGGQGVVEILETIR